MKKHQPTTSGFTLLELLLVLVISAIMVTVGVQFLGGNSVEDKLKRQSQNLAKQLNFMCEKAVFEHRPFAFEFNADAHQLITHRKQEWLAVDERKWPQQPLDSDIEWTLYLQGKPQPLSSDFLQKPHIICYSNGQLSSFELQFKAKGVTTNQAIYLLATKTPSRLTSGWIDEKL